MFILWIFIISATKKLSFNKIAIVPDAFDYTTVLEFKKTLSDH